MQQNNPERSTVIDECSGAFKTQGMCSIKVVEKYPFLLAGAPDIFKTQEMCTKQLE